jgi:hypothetical protein
VEVPSEVREAFGEAQPQVEGEANGVALRSRLGRSAPETRAWRVEQAVARLRGATAPR